MQQNVFLDIGIIIIAATLVVMLAKKFKQPMIPAYIFTGLILGPILTWLLGIDFITSMFNLPQGIEVIANHELITTLSEVGIALLLFIVGLEINLKSFKEVGKVTTMGALINIILLLGLGFLLSVIFGFRGTEAVYLAFVFVFSSTMVLIKALSDKKEIDSLHGKIIIGFLLVEDIVAILALLVLTTINDFSIINFILSITLAVSVIFGIIVISNIVLPKVFRFVASSKDILFLAALGTCFLFSLVFSSIGFSIVIGAFVAGILLGNLPYNFEIIGRIRSLRDFFATLFFVSLGMQLELGSFSRFLPFFIAGFIVITFVKPFMSMIIVGTFGYRKYTAFKVGTSLSQVSEFSLILISQGLALGFVSKDVFSIVVLLAIVTITMTTYTIRYQSYLYRLLKQDLAFLEFTDHLHKTHHHYDMPSGEVVLSGCDRMGRSILNKLIHDGTKPLVIDYNPRIIHKLKEQGIPAMYGDVSNEEVLDHVDFKKVKIVINTIRNVESSISLIRTVKAINSKIIIIDCANKVSDALMLYGEGADYVILPNFLSGDYITFLLGEKSLRGLTKKRKAHIKELHRHKKHFLEDIHLDEEHHVPH
jgi:Kef-type K+ transport system membrane component KefB